jgi:NTE family protein
MTDKESTRHDAHPSPGLGTTDLQSPDASRAMTRALVLGGGGPVGRAWQTGLAIGLQGRGIDLGGADLIIGTSAGALVGALLALKEDLAAAAPHLETQVAPPPSAAALASLATLIAAMAAAAASPDPDAARAEIGRTAVAAPTFSEQDSLARTMFVPLAGRSWPRNFRATAVNTLTCAFTLWDQSCPTPLARAVASSSALPGVYPPITIGEERYMDGGVRSMLNADLAAGHGIVVVVSCYALTLPDDVSNTDAAALNAALRAELAVLRDSGSTVELVTPSEELLALTSGGTRMLDPALTHGAYLAGMRQAKGLADRIGTAWNGLE